MTHPFVSVVMPIRNEAAVIERSLGAVLAQDYPADSVEIIIADGLSDDCTLERIRSIAGPDRVRIIQNPRRIQAAGLNEAIKVARGEIIVRVDGHTVIDPDYLRQCVTLLQRQAATVVGGNMTATAVTMTGQAIAAAVNSGIAVPSAFHYSQAEQLTDTVYMGAWTRQTLIDFGGFNECVGVNEDYELNYRIRRAGGKVLLCPTLRSTYYGRETLAALAHQYYHYGWSRAQTVKLHPASLRVRQLVAPIFVAAMLAGILFPPLWLGLILVYASAVWFLALRIANHVRVYDVFLAIVTIHVLWGLGFWRGLFSWP